MSAVADANRGDFTANPRVLVVTLMAVFIGVASAFVALALTKLIDFFTNLFYYQRLDTSARWRVPCDVACRHCQRALRIS